jgi:signal transduction histidine kinase
MKENGRANSGNTLTLTIADDRKGITNNKLKKGIGLRNTEGRVSTYNGIMNVESKPGKGSD